jgi:hypothetical protein
VPDQKAQEWRDQLLDGDEKEIDAWIERSGPERVARIIVALTTFGKRGNAPRPDTDLMREMAELKREDRERSNHAIAGEVAKEAVATGRARNAEFVNLRDRLYDRFQVEQDKWELVVAYSKAEKFTPDGNKPLAAREARVLDRLIEIMPEFRFVSKHQD